VPFTLLTKEKEWWSQPVDATHCIPPEVVMKRRKKGPTTLQVKRMWELWKQGHTLQAISDALVVSLDAIYWRLSQAGGMAPQPRHRSARTLSVSEREEISRGLAYGDSVRMLACQLGRAPSTISREIRRHGGRERYRAAEADQQAWRRAQRPKHCLLARRPQLRRVVAAKLQADWSPQQIAAWCKMTYPADPTMHVSHETIYRTLYVQTRGALKRELMQHLRRQRLMRRSGPRAQNGRGRGQIVDAIPISARPPEVNDRAVPGHWEGDLLAGTKQSNIATLVERHSRYVMLVRLPDREAVTVAKALIRRVRTLPRGLLQSLTWDRGLEMSQHKQFTVATDAQVYFCDPRSPWQRGSNENTNGLLRQYFPKGFDLAHVTQRQLDAVALKLNTRPRHTLNWKTPAQVLASTVATTG
jgi:IS30 family transposase